MLNKKKGITLTHVGYILAALLCVFVFFYVPQKDVLSKYMTKVSNEGFIYFIATLGLCVMLGMGGQVTFSTAGMMGIGAYTTAILTTRFGWDTLPAMTIAVIGGGIFSFIMGLALFRLKGSYFSFASIGFTTLLFTIFSNWMEVTGGPDGISKIPKLDLYFFQCSNYYDYFRVYFVIAIICFLIVLRMRKTSFGRALASVRDNEIAAKSFGINAYMTKVYSFTIAGVFACLAGAMYALHANYISPEPFKYDQSAIYLIMVMLGGVDSTFGAFIGAMLLTILPEKMRVLQSYYKLVYGIGVIILMNVMPMGIMGYYAVLRNKLRTFIKNKKAAAAQSGIPAETEKEVG